MSITLDDDTIVVVVDALEFYLNTVEDDYLEEPEENKIPYESKLELFYELTGKDFFGQKGYYTKDGKI